MGFLEEETNKWLKGMENFDTDLFGDIDGPGKDPSQIFIEGKMAEIQHLRREIVRFHKKAIEQEESKNYLLERISNLKEEVTGLYDTSNTLIRMKDESEVSVRKHGVELAKAELDIKQWNSVIANAISILEDMSSKPTIKEYRECFGVVTKVLKTFEV